MQSMIVAVAEPTMPAQWPQVQCTTCGAQSHWRRMIKKQELVHIQETINDEDDKWREWHICPSCEATGTGQELEAVMDANFSQPIERKKLRVQRFQECQAKNQQRFDAMGSKREKKVLLRSLLEEMFEPLLHYIELKRRALSLVAKDVVLHAHLKEKLKHSTSLAEDEEIYNDMAKLEVDDKYLAFASKGDAQHSFIQASSYHDHWVSGGKGRVLSFYICMGRTRWSMDENKSTTCRRLIPSKQWEKRHDDTTGEWIKGQRWYCDCGARYMAKHGQVVIIEESNGNVSYLRAEVPSWDLEDVRAMQAEADIQPNTVRELYDKIRTVDPIVTEIVTEDETGAKYIKNAADLESMPRFTWEEVLTLKKALGARL